MGDYLRPISERNLRLFLGFRGTTRAILFAPYIQLFMVKVRLMSWAEYGLLQSLYYVTVVLAEVPSGVLADRIGRKWILVLGALTNALGCFVFALSHDFATFAAGEILFGLGTALISGADSALLYDSLAVDRREAEYPRAEGAAQATWLIVTAVGLPLTDRLLVIDGDPVLAYWFTGGLSVAGLILALFLVEPPLKRRLSARQITGGAIRDVKRSSPILRVIVYSIVIFALLRSSVVGFFHPILQACGYAGNTYGTVLAAMNVAGAFCAWRAHRWLAKTGSRPMLVAMPIAILYMFLFLGLSKHWASPVFLLIQGASFGIYPLLIRSTLNPLVPDARRRATILSLESLACRIAFAPIALFGGWAMGSLGLDAALAATGLLACVPFLILPFLRRDSAVGGATV